MATDTSAEQSSGSTGRVLRSGKVTNPPISEKAKGKRPMEFEDKAKGKVPTVVKSGALTIREGGLEGVTGDKRKAISEQDTSTAPKKQRTTGNEKSDVDKAQTPPVKRRSAERKIVDEHESTVIKSTSPYALRSAKAKDGASAKGQTHLGHTKATKKEQPGKRKRGKAKKKPGVVEELPLSGKRMDKRASRKGGNKKDEGKTSRKIVKGQSSKGKTSNKKASRVTGNKKDEVAETSRKTEKGQSSKGKRTSKNNAERKAGTKKDEGETSRKRERGQSSKGKTPKRN